MAVLTVHYIKLTRQVENGFLMCLNMCTVSILEIKKCVIVLKRIEQASRLCKYAVDYWVR